MNMNETVIEVASKSDLEQILTLQKEAYLSEAELYNDYTLPPLMETLPEIEEEHKKQLFLKIVSDGNLVGSVRRLIVEPRCQNKGLGSKLLQAIEARFPCSIRYELFTGYKSKKNIYLYKKLGYKIIRQLKVKSSLTLVFLNKDR